MSPRAMRIALLLVASCVPDTADTQDPVPVPTAQEWRQDLQTLVTQLEQRHASLFHTISRDSFLAQARRIEEALPRLARHERVIALTRLVASVGDGHTELQALQPAAGFHRAPVALYLYGDTLFIAAADSAHRDLLGARVDSIGRVTARAAYERAAALVSGDNPEEARHAGPAYLDSPEVLAALGIAEADSVIVLVVTGADGRSTRVRLPSARRHAPPRFISLVASAPAGPPLYASHPGTQYWYRALEGSQSLFLQINAMADQQGRPSLARTVDEGLRDADARGLERLIIDLRANSGGNNRLNRPIVEGVRARARFRARGSLFIITGRRTFSAALDLIRDLGTVAQPILVGEPPRGAPFAGGNRESFVLPHSRLVVDYSQQLAVEDFRSGRPRTWNIDIPAPPTIAAARAGRDPALEAVLHAVRE